MKQNSKLRQHEQQETTTQQHVETKSQAKEFSTVEEMLRYDASQNAPSPAVAARLQASLGREQPRASWWKRLVSSFKGK